MIIALDLSLVLYDYPIKYILTKNSLCDIPCFLAAVLMSFLVTFLQEHFLTIRNLFSGCTAFLLGCISDIKKAWV